MTIPGPSPRTVEYLASYARLGSLSAVARFYEVTPQAICRAVKKYGLAREHVPRRVPAMIIAMREYGFSYPHIAVALHVSIPNISHALGRWRPELRARKTRNATGLSPHRASHRHE